MYPIRIFLLLLLISPHIATAQRVEPKRVDSVYIHPEFPVTFHDRREKTERFTIRIEKNRQEVILFGMPSGSLTTRM